MGHRKGGLMVRMPSQADSFHGWEKESAAASWGHSG
jgi:hypothetical protein